MNAIELDRGALHSSPSVAGRSKWARIARLHENAQHLERYQEALYRCEPAKPGSSSLRHLEGARLLFGHLRPAACRSPPRRVRVASPPTVVLRPRPPKGRPPHQSWSTLDPRVAPHGRRRRHALAAVSSTCSHVRHNPQSGSLPSQPSVGISLGWDLLSVRHNPWSGSPLHSCFRRATCSGNGG